MLMVERFVVGWTPTAQCGVEAAVVPLMRVIVSRS
jgi:hypothetical protein